MAQPNTSSGPAPCPSTTLQFFVMFGIYGGMQAALGALALSLYGGQWAAVGAGVGAGAGILFALPMLHWTRYIQRSLTPEQLQFHLQHLAHLAIAEDREIDGWRVFRGKGLNAVAARIFIREREGHARLAAPHGYFRRANKVRRQMQDG